MSSPIRRLPLLLSGLCLLFAAPFACDSGDPEEDDTAAAGEGSNPGEQVCSEDPDNYDAGCADGAMGNGTDGASEEKTKRQSRAPDELPARGRTFSPDR